jgi:hypothetical protein
MFLLALMFLFARAPLLKGASPPNHSIKGIMNMNENITRRALMKGGLIAGVLIPVAGLCVSSDASAASAALDPNDPAAKTLGYVTQSTKPDQKCGTCNQFQGKAGDAQGPCTIFAGKTVVSTGWCQSWVKKSA